MPWERSRRGRHTCRPRASPVGVAFMRPFWERYRRGGIHAARGPHKCGPYECLPAYSALCGTAARMSFTTLSVLTPSASASKLRIRRWRRAGRASVRDVVEGQVEAPVEQRQHLAAQDQRLHRARAGAVAHVALDAVGRAQLVGVRGQAQPHGVAHDMRGGGHAAHQLFHLQQPRAADALCACGSAAVVVRSTISIRSSSLGKPTMILNMKRSSCASGSG